MVKPSQEGEIFLHDYEIFSEFLFLFHILKHFQKYQTLFMNKILNQSTTLIKQLAFSRMRLTFLMIIQCFYYRLIIGQSLA